MTSVVLVQPPSAQTYPFPRLGLAYMAAYLERKGIDTRIVDCTALQYLTAKRDHGVHLNKKARTLRGPIDWDQCVDVITEGNPKVVGISCTFMQDATPALKLARALKARRPDLVVIGGGVHFDVSGAAILRDEPAFDAIVRGEGEEAFGALALGALSGQLEPALKNSIGVYYRDGGQVICHPGCRPEIGLDELPFPARDKLPVEAYTSYFADTDFAWGAGAQRDHPCGIMITSRGCAYRCTYCSASHFWGAKVRMRSAGGIVAEMEHLRERYGLSQFSFVDSSFTVSRRRLLEFCALKQARLPGVTWSCNGVAKGLNAESIATMAKAGCVSINFGAETGSDELAMSMKRGPSMDDIRNVAGLCRDHGIRAAFYFMIGYIGETHETLAATESLMLELSRVYGAYVDSPYIAIPFPGTEFFDLAHASGRIRTLAPEHYWTAKGGEVPDILPYVPDGLTEDEIKREAVRLHDVFRQLS